MGKPPTSTEVDAELLYFEVVEKNKRLKTRIGELVASGRYNPRELWRTGRNSGLIVGLSIGWLAGFFFCKLIGLK